MARFYTRILVTIALTWGITMTACTGETATKPSAPIQLPSDFVPTAALGLANGTGVVAGHSGGRFGTLEERQAFIHLVDAAGAHQSIDTGEGWPIALAEAADGSGLSMVLATIKPEQEGATYWLLKSRDGGQSWSLRHRVPASSATGLAVATSDRAYVIGAGAFVTTGDGGKTWTPLEPPFGVRGVAQPIACPEAGTVVVGGAGAWVSTDAGASWSQIATGEVTATDGHWLASKTGQGVRLGKRSGTTVEWGAEFGGKTQPARVASQGDRVAVVSTPLATTAGRSLRLFAVDGEKSSDEALPGQADAAGIALFSDRVVLVTQKRRIESRAISRP